MIHFLYGTDTEKARRALGKELGQVTKGEWVVRITDAHTLADLHSALQGGGMFGGTCVTVFDTVLGGGQEDMRETLVRALEGLRDSGERFYILEGSLDAATRKHVEKFAEKVEKFDAPKKEKDNSIFALANALQRGDKKALWMGLMREFGKGGAPEALHGLLFWGAKQMLLKARAPEESRRAQSLVAELAELPHLARRRGEDLEYALERFVLSQNPIRA
jgi:DNA polymerase III delta subunit